MVSITTVLSVADFTLPTGNSFFAWTPSTSGSASSVLVKRIRIAQFGTTTSQMIRGAISARDAAGTLTTTAVAPTAIRPAGAVSGFTGSTNVGGAAGRSGVITADSGGSFAELMPFAFMNVAGYSFKPAPDEQVLLWPGTLFVLRLLSTPTSTANWNVTLWFEEMGEFA